MKKQVADFTKCKFVPTHTPPVFLGKHIGDSGHSLYEISFEQM